MSDVGEVRYKATVDNSGIDDEIKKTEKSLGGLNDPIEKTSSKFSGLGQVGVKVAKGIGTAFVGLVSAAATGVAAIAKASLESYAEYEQLVGGVDTLFKESSDKLQGYAAEAYKTAGMSANTYMETATSFAASLIQGLGGDTAAAADYANRAITDMSDNANKMGTDISMIQNAYQGFAKQNYTMLDNLKLGYGGTQEEMKRLISDAAELTDVQEELGITVDSNSMSFDNIVNAISVVQSNMGIMGTTAAEASETIEGSISSMKAAWTNLTVGIADENANIDELLNQFLVSVETVGQNVLPRVEQILTSIGQIVETEFPDIAMRGIEALLSQAPKFVDTALSLVGSFLSAIKDSGPDITNGAIDVIMTLISGFISMLPDIMETAGTLIASLLSGIADHMPQILEMAVRLVASLIEGLLKSIPQIIVAAGELVVSLYDAFKNIDWLQLGKDIVNGIIDGLLSMGSVLWDAAKSLANKALNSLKSAFDSHSPSKKAEKIADTVPQGIVKSFDEDRLVEDAGKRLGSKAIAGLTADVNYNLPDVTSYARSLTADFTPSYRASTAITVPLYLDGREVARATAWWTGEQLSWEEM